MFVRDKHEWFGVIGRVKQDDRHIIHGGKSVTQDPSTTRGIDTIIKTTVKNTR